MIEYIIKMVFYTILGLLILGINLWFALSVKRSFFQTEPPKSIAPFQVIGKEDPDSKLGVMLAQRLRAKLAGINEQMQAARRTLQTHPSDIRIDSPAGPAPPAGQLPQPQYQAAFPDFQLLFEDLRLPDALFEQFDLTLSFGGVDVSGVVAWFQRSFFKEHILRVSIEYHADKVTVVGDGPHVIEAQLKDIDAAIEDIAYSIVRRELSKTFSDVVEIDLNDFKRFLNAIIRYAGIYQEDLDSLVTNQPILPGRYDALLRELESLADKTPRWRLLTLLTARVAELAGNPNIAHALYSRELKQTDRTSAEHSYFDTKVREMEQKIVQLQELVPDEPISASAAGDGKEILSAIRGTQMAERLLKLIGVENSEMREGISVAVLGGLPAGSLAPTEKREYYLADYVDTLAQVVRLVAPAVDFYFDPFEDTRKPAAQGVFDADIIPSLDRLIARKPDVLLIGIGPLRSPQYTHVLDRAAVQGTLVVMAAGNEDPSYPDLFVQPRLIEGAMIVSAVDEEGAPLPYAPDQEEFVWAPGNNVPIYNRRRKTIELRAGTGYSAALAAGIAARVKSTCPECELMDLLELLQKSARPVPGREKPRILNLSAAVEFARERSAQPGPAVVREALVQLAIPDNDPNGVSSTIMVRRTGKLKDIRVRVDISHTYIGDLRVVLITPDGQEIVLHDQQGGGKDNLVATYSPASAPQLAKLTDTRINGDWTLKVADLSRMDVGKFNRWSLELRD